MRGSANADELAFQERVVIRLGLTEWIRLQVEEECDLVGRMATAVLRRHGFLWPPDAHLWTPLLDWAFGGSLLTGVGYSRAGGEAPAFVSRDFRPLSWLWPSARSEVRTLWMADSVRRRRAQRDLGWWLRLRQVRVRTDLLRRLGAPRRVEVCNPLLDPGVVAALAAQPKRLSSSPRSWRVYDRRRPRPRHGLPRSGEPRVGSSPPVGVGKMSTRIWWTSTHSRATGRSRSPIHERTCCCSRSRSRESVVSPPMSPLRA